MEHSDETKSEARRIADAVWELVREHEEDAHDGEPCWEERLGMLAYIGHAIGVRASYPTVILFGDALSEYERTCPNMEGPCSPDDHPNADGNGGVTDLP